MDFGQLALLFSTAAIFGIFASFLKQPLLVGYIFAGFLLSLLKVVPDSTPLEHFGQIGVSLLLFLLGLEINIKELPTIGKPAIATGVGQIVTTFTGGLLLCLTLGFPLLNSLYIAIALTFSSTIIIVKLLSEKKDLESLYGRIAVGFLLVQDFVAIIILIFLSSGANASILSFLGLVFKAVFLGFAVWILSKYIFPKLLDRYISKSMELTYVFSIAWALGISYIAATFFGLTIEIGGFLAGLSLSNTAEHLQISARARPLRDFFLTIFFILLGTRLGVSGDVVSLILPAIVLSVYVLIANPLIVIFIMGRLGYKKRTAFYASLVTAQISEFSLIIMAMGSSLGHFDQKYVSLVTLIGIVTITASTYMILNAQKLYKILAPYLSFFELNKPKENAFIVKSQMEKHIILAGCDRSGNRILDYLIKVGETNFLVIDFNPVVFAKLSSRKVSVIFGDLDDPEIQEASRMNKCRIVISTTSDLITNLSILEFLKKENPTAETIFTAQSKSDGIKLYEAGATYVVIPELSAGEIIKNTLRNYTLKGEKVSKMGKANFDRLLNY